jgi:hypothetical protein
MRFTTILLKNVNETIECLVCKLAEKIGSHILFNVALKALQQRITLENIDIRKSCRSVTRVNITKIDKNKSNYHLDILIQFALK